MRLLFGICFCLRRLTCRMYNPSHAKVSEIKIQWQLCYWFPPWEGALHSQPVAWAERHHLWVRIQHNPLAWNTDGLLVSGWQVGKDFREGGPMGAMFFEEPETLPQIIAEAAQAKTVAACLCILTVRHGCKLLVGSNSSSLPRRHDLCNAEPLASTWAWNGTMAPASSWAANTHRNWGW